MSNNTINRLLVNATQANDEIRFAIVHNNILENVFIEHPGSQKKSNIYKGIITRVERSLQAAFVDFGSARHGFLPFKEVAESCYQHSISEHDNQEISISDVLSEGQEIMVQVDKEERGNKGAALTTYITLAGSYLVLMPNNPRAGGISRRIEGDERDELKEILNSLTAPDNMGIIIRTAGVGKSTAELQWDLDILQNLWEAIKKAYSEHKAPLLLHQESDIVTRAIRDYLREDINEIHIDSEDVFKRAEQHIRLVRPEFTERIYHYQGKNPLFTHFQVENQIETAYQTEVRLPSGGSIVIQPTEALVSIDVNSSRDTKGGHIEQTAYNTNREAAIEIARQLRLRDVGGLVVIDFIDMMAKENQESIVDIFLAETAIDKARVQIGRISKFGLLEASRQRLRPSLSESSQIICPRCNGQGSIRSIKSLALHILRLLREDSMQEGVSELIAHLPVSVATYILNEKRPVISDIETQHQVLLRVIPNPYFEPPHYKIEKIKEEKGGYTGHEGYGGPRKASYNLIARPAPDTSMITDKKQIELEPAVSMVIPKRPEEMGRPVKRQTGILKKLWQTLFGDEVISKIEKPIESFKTSYSNKEQPRHHRQKSRQHPQRRRNNKGGNFQRGERHQHGHAQRYHEKEESFNKENFVKNHKGSFSQNTSYSPHNEKKQENITRHETQFEKNPVEQVEKDYLTSFKEDKNFSTNDYLVENNTTHEQNKENYPVIDDDNRGNIYLPDEPQQTTNTSHLHADSSSYGQQASEIGFKPYRSRHRRYRNPKQSDKNTSNSNTRSQRYAKKRKQANDVATEESSAGE